ncbi:hypothetical protein [Streptomyces sp. NPDC059176]|uniref:hypothetical protein n=1 Tax=unclassified Streptomyces TaxID=2593676 RepID=UPI0036965C91
MSIRYGQTVRGKAAVALVATTLSLTLTACGGDEKGSAKEKVSDSAPAKEGDAKPNGTSSGGAVPDSSKTLAVINGSNGFKITIRSAVREGGGFLTVSGTIQNTTGKRIFAPIQWNGQESSVKRTGPSLAGTTLVDKTEKKRYYVLRDTDGFPLTTTGITGVNSGSEVEFFAQFPSPPDKTTQVDIQIPLMPTATIEIS